MTTPKHNHRPAPDVDVLVVGAGPAGAAAAVGTARAGLTTLVIDQATFPRDKCCGDGLTALALRELERAGLRPAMVPSWQPITGVTVRSPSGRERSFPLPTDGVYAAVAQRWDLDAALVGLARSAGADVADGHRLTGAAASSRGDMIRVDVEGIGTVTAGWAVGADGMWSPLRKALDHNQPGYRGEWHAFRQYFRNTSLRSTRELFVWFEPDLLPAYAWLFPLPDGRANVGFGVRRGGRHRIGAMGRIWSELLARPHIRRVLGPEAEPEQVHRSWPIPARVGRSPLTGPRTLFVGDAAAVTDPMTGEGIGQALLTGRLAAEAIIAESEGPNRTGTNRTGTNRTGTNRTGTNRTGTVAASYERRVRRELVADDRVSRALTHVLSHPSTTRAGLRVAGANSWTRRNFARWMFEDYPRAVLATPRRWGPGVFSTSGAFGHHRIDDRAGYSTEPRAPKP